MTDFDGTPMDEEVSLDTLADIPVDMGEVTQGLKDASLPAGWYTTDPELGIVSVGRSDKTSRPYARFFGAITGPESGKYGFGWSWERHNRIVDGVDTGKPDQMYKNFATLVTLYEKAHEERPKKVDDVNKWVASIPIQIRLVPGRDGGDPFLVAMRLVP